MSSDIQKCEVNEDLIQSKKYPNLVVNAERNCTNKFSLIIFIICIIGWILIAYYAFSTNNFKRVVYPSDSSGRICGTKKAGVYDLTDKPYLLFFDLTKCVSWASFLSGCPTKQVCVNKCPNKYFTYLQLHSTFSDANFHKKMKKEIICSDDKIKNNIKSFEQLRKYVQMGECAGYTVNSAPLIGRCLPKFVTKLVSNNKKIHNKNNSLDEIVLQTGSDKVIPDDFNLQNNVTILYENIEHKKGILRIILEDLYISKWKILFFLSASTIISLLYIGALRALGNMILWCTIGIVFIAFLLIIAYCGHQYKMLNDEKEIMEDSGYNIYVESSYDTPDLWKYIGGVVSVLFIIMGIIFIKQKHMIKNILDIMRQTNKALFKMPSLLLFPFLTLSLHILCFIFFATLLLMLSTSGKENCRRVNTDNNSHLNFQVGEICDCNDVGTTEDTNCRFIDIQKDDHLIIILQFYNLFIYFWSSCFVSGFHKMVLAGAIGSYWWSYNKKKDFPQKPVIGAIQRTARYHLGSIALGSLIIAIIKVVRAILQWLYEKMKGSQNKIVKTFYCLLSIWFWLLENVLKFLTINSYIIIAIHGKPFWTSSKHAVTLISRNLIRFIIINKVVSVILFIGKLSVALLFGFLSYEFFSGKMFDEDLVENNLNNYLIPVVFIFIGTYYIADLFFDVYEFGVSTTLICFLDDLIRHNGSSEKPYYMSSGNVFENNGITQ
uniref:Choline transporter-like protein n=1 Tax=Parastrongyloides trichosuri TaxID=131310 RepID=A0A0N4ZWB9_PARTI